MELDSIFFFLLVIQLKNVVIGSIQFTFGFRIELTASFRFTGSTKHVVFASVLFAINDDCKFEQIFDRRIFQTSSFLGLVGGY